MDTYKATMLNYDYVTLRVKLKKIYEDDGKFKPSWNGKKKWLLKVDGVFGPRTCSIWVE